MQVKTVVRPDTTFVYTPKGTFSATRVNGKDLTSMTRNESLRIGRLATGRYSVLPLGRSFPQKVQHVDGWQDIIVGNARMSIQEFYHAYAAG